ncbi:hypothetical protein [Enterococcus crotali]|uniref:hypothetical protein n=1 Tax=Enterococcus crotali TaxID=1453587 RepID=UPI00047258FF|nr:hypothetical protein [Enterococcus crotali]
MRKRILTSLSYTFTSNMVNLFTSFFLIIFVPKFIGVELYGYWQLYIFYTTYLQYVTFGIPEGIYLEFGGSHYNELPKKRLRNQFLNLFVVSLFFMLLLIFVGIYGISTDSQKSTVLIFSAIALLLIVPRSVLTYELQATDELKLFSVAMILEKMLLIIGIISLVILRVTKFEYFIIVDLFSKLITNILLVYVSRSLVFGKIKSLSIGIKDSVYFCKIGINITLSNLSSILVMGIIRMSIELKWSIQVFGKISLIISMTNMIMVFINSISIVFFPILKRMESNKLKEAFKYIDKLLSSLLLNILFLYFPIYLFLQLFLPAYSSGLKYLAFIFPMTIFESKIAVLYNTYLKVLRMERKLLQVNILMVLMTIVVIYPVIWIFESLDGAVFMITIVSILKSYFFRKILNAKLEINQSASIPWDSIIVLTFVCCSIFFSLYQVFLIMLIIVGVFNVYNFSKNRNAWRHLKENINSNS